MIGEPANTWTWARAPGGSRPRRDCQTRRGARPAANQVQAAPKDALVSDYIVGSDAVLDLEDIREYIADDSIEAADRWIATLFEAFETIAGMSGIGHSRKDLPAFPVLFWTAESYLVIYSVRSSAP